MPTAASLYYLEHNTQAFSQPPVVLIHGAGGDRLYWPPQIRRLPHGRIYAIDLPGHGLSGRPGCQRIEDYAQAIIYWMDALKLPGIVAIGHSMGGAIALQLALSWPQRILGLGLIATSAHLPVAPSLLNTFARDETVAQGIDMVIRWSFAPQTDEKLKNLARRRMAQARPTVLHGDFLACNAFDVRARLPEIRAPALILAGSADKMTPLHLAQSLQKGLPQARLQTFPQAGHMLMLERPQETAQALEAWLPTLPYRPGY